MGFFLLELGFIIRIKMIMNAVKKKKKLQSDHNNSL